MARKHYVRAPPLSIQITRFLVGLITDGRCPTDKNKKVYSVFHSFEIVVIRGTLTYMNESILVTYRDL